MLNMYHEKVTCKRHIISRKKENLKISLAHFERFYYKELRWKKDEVMIVPDVSFM